MKRQPWLSTLAEPSVLDALHEAARNLMRDGCERHEPDRCNDPMNLVTPAEFVEWVELEVRTQQSVRSEVAGRPGRRRPTRLTA